MRSTLASYFRTAIFVSLLAGIPAVALGQTRFAVETPKRPTFTLSEVGTKLAPELRPTVAADAPFVGLTRKGDPVLEFPATMPAKNAKDTLATAHLSATQLSSETSLVPAKRLLVFIAAPSPLPESTIGDFRIISRNPTGGYVVVEAPDKITSDNLIKLIENPVVRYVEPDFAFYLNQSATPNDPEYVAGKLWGLKAINAPAAWSKATASNVIVAVVDSGIDYSHKDLDKNVWVGPNGVHGYNFVDNNNDPRDKYGHGTHVSGIIGAIGNNAEGVVGIAWSVSIMAIQVFDNTGAFSTNDNVSKAVDYAVKNGAKIINVSWNGPNFSQAVKEAINRAEKAGVLFVAAAGNDYSSDNDITPSYPASYTNANIIVVLSIDEDEQLSAFSNFGKTSVHLGAPGAGIESSVPGGYYNLKSGTSMAAPYVSGAAALVWSLPTYHQKTAVEIKQLLLDNTQPLAALKDKAASGGMLDLTFLAKPALASVPAKPSIVTGVIGFLADHAHAIVSDFEATAEHRFVVQTGRDFVQIDPSTITAGFEETLRSLRGEPVTIAGAIKNLTNGGPALGAHPQSGYGVEK